MPNMGYCRFENTLRDLRDCAEHICDVLTGDERRARAQLMELCAQILQEGASNVTVEIEGSNIEITEYDDEKG